MSTIKSYIYFMFNLSIYPALLIGFLAVANFPGSAYASTCGDGSCGHGETKCNCPADCDDGDRECGNGCRELGEECDGGACCDSLCQFRDATFVCRASTGACDVAETCRGNSGGCPANAFKAPGFPCGGSDDSCDALDTCNGSGSCIDRVDPSSTECFPAGTDPICDPADTCDGIGKTCPAKFSALGTACGGSDDSCDALDTCDGIGSCVDRVDDAGTECLAAGANPTCDPADTCDGASKSCPENLASSGTACDDGQVCAINDSCDGSGACVSVAAQPVTILTLGAIPNTPVPINQSLTLNATYDDSNSVEPHSASIAWGDLSSSAGTVDQGANTVTASHAYSIPGVYSVDLTVSDTCESATKTYEFVVVYDPTGGFVTGGGTIDSPAGAYLPDASLTGKASFGFVSKYIKGKTLPQGNTEFQFRAGDLNFSSVSYQWLIIAGNKGKYKGDGTINGSGSYGFLLSATDTGKTTAPDRFRIKIWDKNNGDALVYDNCVTDPGRDDQDLAEDCSNTVISSGSIVIHK